MTTKSFRMTRDELARLENEARYCTTGSAELWKHRCLCLIDELRLAYEASTAGAQADTVPTVPVPPHPPPNETTTRGRPLPATAGTVIDEVLRADPAEAPRIVCGARAAVEECVRLLDTPECVRRWIYHNGERYVFDCSPPPGNQTAIRLGTWRTRPEDAEAAVRHELGIFHNPFDTGIWMAVNTRGR